MGVTVAEYLGVRTDGVIPIQPIPISKTRTGQKPRLPCPFKSSHCDKASRGDKPVCSVRDTATGALWITCEHRLCATSPKNSPLTTHQSEILHEVAQVVFGTDIQRNEVLVKREEPIKVTENSDYSADYVMWRRNPKQTSPFNPDRAMIVEMQGGGETTNTGTLTKHIDEWEVAGVVDNSRLCRTVSKTSPLITNAWRRQQEQFLVKGNVAMLTGGRMVFCVGSMIYDYLIQRFRSGILLDLKTANWTLALVTFMEDSSGIQNPSCAPSSIKLKIDPTRTLFTNYSSFVQVLINQATPSTSLFTGEYFDLIGGVANI
jgi:hypothetical protein